LETNTEVAAPQTPPPEAPAAPETPAVELSHRDQIKQELAKFRAAQAKEAESATAAEASTKVDTKAPPADDLELKLSKQALKVSDLQAELRATREELKTAKSDGPAKMLDGVKEDPLKAIGAFKEIFGRDFGEFSRWIVENADKIESSRKYATLPKEVREELELARKERAERTSTAEAEATRKQVSNYANNVALYLKENAEDYPIAFALDFSAGHLVEQFGVGKVKPEHIKAYEKNITDTIVAVISQDNVLKHLIKSNDKVKEAVLAAVNAKSQSNSQGTASKKSSPTATEGPSSLSNQSASGAQLPTSQKHEETTAEYTKRMLAEWKAKNGK